MPADPTTIDEAIEQAALSPKRVTVAGQSVELPSIDELLKAKAYEAGQQGKSKRGFGLRFQQIIPGGCG